MNYKDALNVSINDKLTKAKLIDIANTLQNELLANELDAAQMNSITQAQIIPFSNYIKDAQSRMDIHHHEMRELNKDVRYVINYVKDKYNLVSTLIAAK